jgi:hypothetical protein
MPHKHTRKAGDNKETCVQFSLHSETWLIASSSIDLPPSQVAKPLSTNKNAAANGIFTTSDVPKRSNKKRKRNKDAADDTPKAFVRLMMMKEGKKLPKGLDDGFRETKAMKKRKLAEQNGSTPATAEKALETPTIRPGEKMSEFSMRVDQALPVSGLINKTARGGKDPLGLKVGRTKTEKKMHRMYDEWREQDKKIKEKREEAMEDAEEEAMDEDGQVKWKVDIEPSNTKKKGKGKRKKLIGELDDGDDDPWAQLKKNRAEVKAGLHDVVLAPPTFTKAPKEKFKMRGARVEVDDVPKASGSLRRREVLGDVRRSVVEGYRAMMKANKENNESE